MRTIAITLLLAATASAQSPRHLYEGTKQSGTARVEYSDGSTEDVALELTARRFTTRPSPWNYFKLEFRAPGLVFMIDNSRTAFDRDYLDPPDFYERIQNHERRYFRDQMVLVMDGEYLSATEWDMLHVNGVWGPYDPTAGSHEPDYRPEYLDISWYPETEGLPRWDNPADGIDSIALLDLTDSVRMSYMGRVIPEPTFLMPFGVTLCLLLTRRHLRSRNDAVRTATR